MGSPLKHGRPPESCFLDSGRSPDTSALEKVHRTGFHLWSGRSLVVPLQDNDVFKSPKRSDGLCLEHHLQSIVLVNQAQPSGHEDSPYKHAHREAGMAHCFAKTATNILTHTHTHTHATHATTLKTSVDDKEKKNNSTSAPYSLHSASLCHSKGCTFSLTRR